MIKKTFALLFLLSLLPHFAFAEKIAHLEDVSGFIKITHKNGVDGATNEYNIKEGDHITTGPDGKATIVYADGTEVRVFSNSKVKASFNNGLLSANVKKGSIWAHIPKRKKNRARFALRTAEAIIGIRGTTLAVDARKPEKTNIGMFEGVVSVRNGKLKTSLASGQLMRGVEKTGSLKKKIEPITQHLEVTSSTKALDLQRTDSLRINVKLVSSGATPPPTEGLVFISVNIRQTTLNRQLTLDAHGRAQTTIKFNTKTPKKNVLVVHALMEDNWEVASGVTHVKLKNVAVEQDIEGLRNIEAQ
ncbi:MAG: FecR family protein [SAR324 cluster bacterium]|nr:FecR family protein [SAR324 cluster bacterium]